MTTKLTDIINPQVMGDMIEAKIPHMLKFTPFAKVDTTLVGVPGDTKTVPSWNFIGAAEDLEEGKEITPKKLTASTAEFKIKCAAQSIGIQNSTPEATRLYFLLSSSRYFFTYGTSCSFES